MDLLVLNATMIEFILIIMVALDIALSVYLCVIADKALGDNAVSAVLSPLNPSSEHEVTPISGKDTSSNSLGVVSYSEEREAALEKRMIQQGDWAEIELSRR